MTSVADDNQLPEFVRADVYSLLPFSAAALTVWGANEDVCRFLYGLFDHTITMTDSDGSETASTGDFGNYLFETELDRIRSEFLATLRSDAQAQISHGLLLQEQRQRPLSPLGLLRLTPFDPETDSTLGLSIKYLLAWRAIVNWTLSEAWFFSLAHLLEADNNVEASFLTASHSLYRQAMQLMRGYLEDLTVALHFTADRTSYELWRNGSYRIPNMRGKKGLIERLSQLNLLDAPLAEELNELYFELGQAVHGAEARLTHSGLYSGDDPPGYKADRLLEWASYCSRCILLGIHLLTKSVRWWQANRPAGRYCDVCHNTTEFVVDKYSFAHVPMARYTCTLCGSISHYTEDRSDSR